ncbi:MAG: YceH family protein [Candidatus Synoicihabitans palmerolidicus]|nr:YceH family protein [Candidatus Synoicihabitans palmerolidicus]
MESEDTSNETKEPVLSLLEARVVGCLMEKESTTPDVYPLSLNSLVKACNQKSNRSPLMQVGEVEVSAAIELLREKHLVTLFSGAGARAVKFRHKFDDMWPMEPAARAMMAELMLRGPQTAAGLRGNGERMAGMPDLGEVELILGDLAARPAGALVRKLERQPGQKESRWCACIMDEGELAAVGNPGDPGEEEDALLRASAARGRPAVGGGDQVAGRSGSADQGAGGGRGGVEGGVGSVAIGAGRVRGRVAAAGGGRMVATQVIVTRRSGSDVDQRAAFTPGRQEAPRH